MSDVLPLSVLLLARDEGERLAQLIPTLRFAREVVVVWDPAGRAATREIAERLGARVHVRALDGFGPQRQYALSQCREPWVLWLDADETLDAAALRAIAARVTAGGDTHGYTIARHGHFLGRRIRFCGWQGERIVRLFRRDRARFDNAEVHETVRVDGPPPVLLAGLLEHHSYRTFEDCVSKCVRYASAGAAQAERRGRRAGPLDVLVRPPLRFLRQYVLQLGFLDGTHGLVLCGFAAAQVYLKYAELWQRTRSGSRG
jgi:(heptosyl)LPS beta-1,4-glucosyltransferase